MCDYRDYGRAHDIFCASIDYEFFIGAGQFLSDYYEDEFQESMNEYFSYGDTPGRDTRHKHFTSKLMEIVI